MRTILTTTQRMMNVITKTPVTKIMTTTASTRISSNPSMILNKSLKTSTKLNFSDSFWDAPTLKYKDVKKITEAPTEDKVLIDVREPNEVIQGSIPSSVNLPLSNFEHSLDLDDSEFKKLYGFDKPSNGVDDNRNFIFYCRSGKRSATACDLAIRRGIKNINNYEGSYIDWLQKQSEQKSQNDEDDD